MLFSLIFFTFLPSYHALGFFEPYSFKCNLNHEYEALEINNNPLKKTTNFQQSKKDTVEVLFALKRTSVIQLFKNKKLIVKIYPKNGLDVILIDKENFSVELTKDVSFVLLNKEKKTQVFCEYK